jgi:hypothetical protein
MKINVRKEFNRIDLRRISGLFLGELFYKNDEIKKSATKLLQIYPPEGRVIIILTPDLPQPNPITDSKIPFHI